MKHIDSFDDLIRTLEDWRKENPSEHEWLIRKMGGWLISVLGENTTGWYVLFRGEGPTVRSAFADLRVNMASAKIPVEGCICDGWERPSWPASNLFGATDYAVLSITAKPGLSQAKGMFSAKIGEAVTCYDVDYDDAMDRASSNYHRGQRGVWIKNEKYA